MLYNIHLQTFADGAGEAVSQAAAENGTAENREAENPETAAPEKQAEPQDKKTKFKDLISGEYKTEAQEWFQGGLNERFRNHNKALAEAQQQLADWKEAVNPYLAKLGVDPNDLEAVRAAAMEDQSNFRSRALAENITIEEAIQRYQDERATQKQQAEQQRLAQEAKERAEMEQQAAEYEGWRKEAEAIRKDDPGFDLSTEINNNPAFAGLLDKGVSVTDAYRATHYEANMAKVAGAVERQTAINTANRISAGQKRPPEGGLSPNAAMRSTRPDYKNLPSDQIMAIYEASLRKG